MCTTFEKEITTMKEDLLMFKFAPYGKSEFEPEHRSSIEGWKSQGQRLRYPVGERITSPSGPGIMGYAQQHPWAWGICWFELRVPAGATIRKGTMNNHDIIAASEVYVVGEARQP